MASILKVDSLLTSEGTQTTPDSLGIDMTGHVVQYKYTRLNSAIDTSSTSYIVALETFITPKSATNLLVMQISGQFYKYNNTAGGSVPWALRKGGVTFNSGDYLYWASPEDFIHNGSLTGTVVAGTTASTSMQFVFNAGSAGRTYIYPGTMLHVWEIAQ